MEFLLQTLTIYTYILILHKWKDIYFELSEPFYGCIYVIGSEAKPELTKLIARTHFNSVEFIYIVPVQNKCLNGTLQKKKIFKFSHTYVPIDRESDLRTGASVALHLDVSLFSYHQHLNTIIFPPKLIY